jgi:hypothetical protein
VPKEYDLSTRTNRRSCRCFAADFGARTHWEISANDFWIVREIGPSVTHHYDSMVEGVWILLQTLDPHPVATRVNARLEMKCSI